MGTRSLTKFYGNGKSKKPFAVMYRQMDGYPEGHGKELAAFLAKLGRVNGISDFKAPIANGIHCLAAQVVEHFKDGVGSIYLMDAGDHGQDFEYEVREGGCGQPWDLKVYQRSGGRRKLLGQCDPREYTTLLAKLS